MRTIALVFVSIALVAPAAAGEQRVPPTRAAGRVVTPRGPLLATEQATISLFEKSRASVTYISTQSRVVDAWTRNVFSVPRGTGSGFVWDADGHIVTNFHVLAGASSARVRFSDGRDVAASALLKRLLAIGLELVQQLQVDDLELRVNWLQTGG